MLLARDIAWRSLITKEVVSAWLRQPRSLPLSATLGHSVTLDLSRRISKTAADRAASSSCAPSNPENGEPRQTSDGGHAPSQASDQAHRLVLRGAADGTTNSLAVTTEFDEITAVLSRGRNPVPTSSGVNSFGDEDTVQRTPFARIHKGSRSKTPAMDARNTTKSNLSPRRKTGARDTQFERTPGTVSPAGALRIYLNAISKEGVVDESEWKHFQNLLSKMPRRLPILTAHALLRQREREGRLTIRERLLLHLAADDVWAGRLDEAAKEGYSGEMIAEWAWIVSAKSADAAIERLLAAENEKPLFLITILLDSDRPIQNPRLFAELLQYLCRHYVGDMSEYSPPANCHDFGKLPKSSLARLIKRLVHHSLHRFPALLPSVARFVSQIIEAQAAQTDGRPGRWHAARCFIFNKALWYFSHPPSHNALENMVYNWEAQKELLKLSSKMHPPLFIGRHGYQAIRKVMVALKKTPSEQDAVKRAAKTWPPYRRALDGRDESLTPEDSLSRSVRAGSLMVEAGYPDDNVDQALDVLGGSKLGRAPTIQTRTLVSHTSTGQNAELNVFTEWSAKIVATRTTREAWEAFNHPPFPSLRPNAAVYAEMFAKLFARESAGGQYDPLPGDAQRVFPAYDGNLSAFEISRITPPTPKDLYDMMLASGVRPVRRCLHVLIQSAHTKTEAIKYLLDSNPEHPQLAATLQRADFFGVESADPIRKMSFGLLRAWVAMLCSTHQQSQRGHIEEAIKLASAFEIRNVAVRSFDKTAWYRIIHAIAGQKVLYGQLAELNPLKTLKTFLAVWEKTRSTTGPSPILFEQLCRVISKTLRLSVFRDTKDEVRTHRTPFTSLPLRNHLHRAYALMERCFVDPETAFYKPRDDKRTLVYKITGRQVFYYMQALSTMGDARGAVRLMDWLLDAWGRDDLLRDAKNPHELEYHEVIETFSCFVGMARRMIDEATLQRLADRLESLRNERGCTWYWPPATEEYERYVNLDAVLEARFKSAKHARAKRAQPHRRGSPGAPGDEEPKVLDAPGR